MVMRDTPGQDDLMTFLDLASGNCKHGVCSVDINSPDMKFSFQNLGVQCVRKKDAPESLERRKKIKVDPFKQGFNHSKKANIDLNQCRLCFQVRRVSPQCLVSKFSFSVHAQVFLKTDKGLVPLEPVVSNIIKDRKAHTDLQIIEYSDDHSPVEGGKKIMLFCEKVNKDDIEVHFIQHTKGKSLHDVKPKISYIVAPFHSDNEEIIAKGDFSPTDVHKQYGICLRTPPYVNKDIKNPVQCSMMLYKPKDKSYSEPVSFWYTPSPTVVGAQGFQAEAKPVKRTREPRQNQVQYAIHYLLF